MTRWLKKDYAVTAFDSGEQALAYLEKEQPDLVLLDYEMPDMDGSVVLEKIRTMPGCQDLPVMFLTGTEDQGNLKKVEELHPAGVLIKTLGKKGLLTEIAAFFD
jgi:CheY-like chemotaxis protein